MGLATDGDHLYWSANGNTLPNAGNDLYRFKADAPPDHRLTDIAPDQADENGIEVQGVLGASADGSYVYYAANGIPEGGVQNSPNANGESAGAGTCKGPYFNASGVCNLYLWHDDGTPGGTTTFIARLDASGKTVGDVVNWIPSSAGFTGIEHPFAEDGPRLLRRPHPALPLPRAAHFLVDNEGVGRCSTAGGWGRAGPPASPAARTAPSPSGIPTVGGSENVKAVTPAAARAYVLSRNLSAGGDRSSLKRPKPWSPGTSTARRLQKLGAPHRPSSNSRRLPGRLKWEAPGTGSWTGTQTAAASICSPRERAKASSSAMPASAETMPSSSPAQSSPPRTETGSLTSMTPARAAASPAQNPSRPSPAKQSLKGPAIALCSEERSASSRLFVGPPDPVPSRKACPKASSRRK